MSKQILLISKADLSSSEQEYERNSNFSSRIIDTDVQLLESYSPSTFDEARVLWKMPSDSIQAELYRVLKPKGKILVEKAIADRPTGQVLVTDLQITGFMDLMAAKDPITGDRFVVGEKPNWDNCDVAKINVSKGSSGIVKMVDSKDEEFVDENDLLNAEIVVNEPLDCGSTDNSGKRRACKDCSCGLADITDDIDTVIDKSACGNCYKGDAFRCGNCPFLGKPAFDANSTTVKLSLTDDF